VSSFFGKRNTRLTYCTSSFSVRVRNFYPFQFFRPKSDRHSSCPLFSSSAFLPTLFLLQPSRREEGSNPTHPTVHFCCRFFFTPFRICLDWNGPQCLQEVCCCRVPASPRSAAAARLRLQDLLLPRDCISKVDAGSCLALLLLFFFFCVPTRVTCLLLVVSQPQFFSVTERGPWGGVWPARVPGPWAGGWSTPPSWRSAGGSRHLVDALFFLYLLREIWSSFKDSISKRALDNLLMLYFLYLLMRHRFFFCVFLQDGGGAVTAVATWWCPWTAPLTATSS
jgi:hypothetical protein